MSIASDPLAAQFEARALGGDSIARALICSRRVQSKAMICCLTCSSSEVGYREHVSITDEVRSSKLKPSTVIKELDLQPSLEPVTGGDAFGDGDGTAAPAHCHDGAYFAGLKYVNHAALDVSTCIKSSFLHFPCAR